MDETSDPPPRPIMEYRHLPILPYARAPGGSSPRPLRMGERVSLVLRQQGPSLININPKKRKLSGSRVQDGRLAKRLNMDSNSSMQSGPSHEVSDK